MGLRVIVQSERDSAFVESRIDAFWDDYKLKLDEMSDGEFEKYKATVISRKLEDFKNLWQECVCGGPVAGHLRVPIELLGSPLRPLSAQVERDVDQHPRGLVRL